MGYMGILLQKTQSHLLSTYSIYLHCGKDVTPISVRGYNSIPQRHPFRDLGGNKEYIGLNKA